MLISGNRNADHREPTYYVADFRLSHIFSSVSPRPAKIRRQTNRQTLQSTVNLRVWDTRIKEVLKERRVIMECLIGIQGAGFVLLASDTTSARSIVKMKAGNVNLNKHCHWHWHCNLLSDSRLIAKRFAAVLLTSHTACRDRRFHRAIIGYA